MLRNWAIPPYTSTKPLLAIHCDIFFCTIVLDVLSVSLLRLSMMCYEQGLSVAILLWISLIQMSNVLGPSLPSRRYNWSLNDYFRFSVSCVSHTISLMVKKHLCHLLMQFFTLYFLCGLNFWGIIWTISYCKWYIELRLIFLTRILVSI